MGNGGSDGELRYDAISATKEEELRQRRWRKTDAMLNNINTLISLSWVLVEQVNL